MSTTTTTGAGSNGSEADKADQNATGGDTNTETDNGSNKSDELEKNFTRTAHKVRSLEKSLKDVTSKLEAVLSRITPEDGDDDDEGDDEGDEDSQGDDSRNSQDSKSKGAQDGGKSKNPEVRKLLKKLERERKDSRSEVQRAKEDANSWKSRFEQTERRRVLNDELAKHKVLPQARPLVIKLVENDIEVNVDDDGTIEVSHRDYPSVGKFLEEFLNENLLFLENTRAGGTGDGGGADRSSGGGGGFKLPNGFQNWDAGRQREWVMKLTPEQRKQAIKLVGW